MTATDQSLTVVVVDDEPLARRRLARLLRKDGSVEVVVQCAGGRAAVDEIRQRRPDLVFLDIQMPDLDGFGVVEAIGPEQMPAVVFVTAYDAYALRAFDVHAVDYLLKPYDEERFATALARARTRIQTAGSAGAEEARLHALLREMLARVAAGESGRARYPERLAVRTSESTRILQMADVDWFETYGNYVRVHAGRATYLIRSTATRLMEELDPLRANSSPLPGEPRPCHRDRALVRRRRGGGAARRHQAPALALLPGRLQCPHGERPRRRRAHHGGVGARYGNCFGTRIRADGARMPTDCPSS
jgi:two-component system LytT family response regulator